MVKIVFDRNANQWLNPWGEDASEERLEYNTLLFHWHRLCNRIL